MRPPCMVPSQTGLETPALGETRDAGPRPYPRGICQVVDLVTSLDVLRDCDFRGNAVSRLAKYFERTVTR